MIHKFFAMNFSWYRKGSVNGSLLSRISLLLGGALISAHAIAQSFPSRPIELVVPYAPGGASDLIARAISVPLGAALSGNVVVVNKGGANTAIAAQYVAHAPADGHVIMLADVALLLNSVTMTASPGYNPEKDFTPIGRLGSAPFVLFVRSAGGANLKDFLAKGRLSGLSIANAGPGSLGHLAAELLKLRTGVQIVSVPYRGSGPALAETLSGQVDATLGSMASGMPLVRSGQLRALAIAGPNPIPELPNVPTFSQAGLNGVYAQNWWGLVGPAGMKPNVVSRLWESMRKVMQQPEVRGRFAALGTEVAMSNPEEFNRILHQDLELWRGVVRDAKIHIN